MGNSTTCKPATSTDAAENILWEEIKKALTYFNGALLYTDRKRKQNRTADAIMIALGITATLLKDLSPWIPSAALAAIAAMLTCKSDIIRVLQSENELAKLDAIGTFYQSYFYDVEQLYFSLRYNSITHNEAMERLRALRKQEYGKEAEYNRLVRDTTKEEGNYIATAVNTYYNNYITTEANE